MRVTLGGAASQVRMDVIWVTRLSFSHLGLEGWALGLLSLLPLAYPWAQHCWRKGHSLHAGTPLSTLTQQDGTRQWKEGQ